MALEDLVNQKTITNEEGPYEQFEKCDVEKCIYHNDAGFCGFETCRIKNENPATAEMVIKTCKVCGDQFATNFNEMAIQICDNCLEGFLKAEGHPHDCVFCGASLDENPSIFWPVCDSCMDHLKKAAQMAHCDNCG